jgi:hypothetical protein
MSPCSGDRNGFDRSCTQVGVKTAPFLRPGEGSLEKGVDSGIRDHERAKSGCSFRHPRRCASGREGGGCGGMLGWCCGRPESPALERLFFDLFFWGCRSKFQTFFLFFLFFL